MRERRRYFFGIGLCAAVVFTSPFFALAASLNFSPAAKTVSVGESFTVAVTISSPDKAMNAASGVVSFPSDKLQALSVSNSGSVMNLWVQNPSVSNASAAGNVNFAGVVLNPGYLGTAGNVVTIRFQAIATGNAQVSFSSGSILANDGKGTDILTSVGAAKFAINPAPPVAASSAPAINGPPPAAVGTTTATTTASISVKPIVVVNSAMPWDLLLLLLALFIVLIFTLLYSLIHRRRHLSNHDFLHKRKELRDDLRRIEKELEADRSGSTIDLSALGARKKKENIRREIEHLEEDITRDIKDTD